MSSELSPLGKPADPRKAARLGGVLLPATVLRNECRGQSSSRVLCTVQRPQANGGDVPLSTLITLHLYVGKQLEKVGKNSVVKSV